MPQFGLDVDQVVRLDDRRDIAIDELAAVLVNDARFSVKNPAPPLISRTMKRR